MSGVPAEIFEEFGSDADAALAAMANVFPTEWHRFVDDAAAAQYRSAHASWVRSRTATVVIPANQTQLFDDITMDGLTIRSLVVLRIDGKRREFNVTELAGDEGAEVLERVADRDSGPARESLQRADVMRQLAQAVRAESKAQNRPVSVGEIIQAAS